MVKLDPTVGADTASTETGILAPVTDAGLRDQTVIVLEALDSITAGGARGIAGASWRTLAGRLVLRRHVTNRVSAAGVGLARAAARQRAARVWIADETVTTVTLLAILRDVAVGVRAAGSWLAQRCR